MMKLETCTLTTEYEKPKRERLPSWKGGNMSSSVTVAPDGGNAPQGCCNRCHKVWILKERQGVCPWCHKPASCITATSKPRHLKSRSRQQRKQAVSGNGYDQLSGEYLTYYRIASRFSGKVREQDKGDVLHDIIMTLADVERNNGHKPFTEAGMYRIASRTVALYWRSHYKYTNGLTCGNCSKAQRRACKENYLYGSCPKAISLESLDKPVIDADGNTTDLGNLIADDKALDLEAWADAKTFLLGCPDRLITIAEKLRDSDTLTGAERKYLCKWRQREQKALIAG
jgi:hypothetical protein